MSGEFQSHRVSEIKKGGDGCQNFPRLCLRWHFRLRWSTSWSTFRSTSGSTSWFSSRSSRFFGWATSFLNRLIDYCQSEILCFIPNFRLQRSYGIPQLFRRRQHVRYHSGRFFPWHTASLILSANLINLSFSSQFFLEFLRVIFLRQRIISEYLQK